MLMILVLLLVLLSIVAVAVVAVVVIVGGAVVVVVVVFVVAVVIDVAVVAVVLLLLLSLLSLLLFLLRRVAGRCVALRCGTLLGVALQGDLFLFSERKSPLRRGNPFAVGAELRLQAPKIRRFVYVLIKVLQLREP